MIESEKEYRKMGKERWVQQQIKKAEEGFELHTQKCYAFRLSTPENKSLRPQ